MFDFSHKKKMQVYDNLRSVMQICIDRIVNLNKDGKGKQDAEELRNDFAYAFHCMDLCSEYRWIPCSERLPEEDGEYLALIDGTAHRIHFAPNYKQFGYWNMTWDIATLAAVDTEWDAFETVTHWMPLPEPPEEV